jgi:hypothetical protein
LVAGGNADLKPILARSLSLGVLAKPAFWPNTSLTINWAQIEKTDDIVVPLDVASNLQVLQQWFPNRITRALPVLNDSNGVGPITHIDGTGQRRDDKDPRLDRECRLRRRAPVMGPDSILRPADVFSRASRSRPRRSHHHRIGWASRLTHHSRRPRSVP